MEWHKVSDKLPEDHQRCIVRIVCDDGYMYFTNVTYYRLTDGSDWPWGTTGHITHWTPEPELE